MQFRFVLPLLFALLGSTTTTTVRAGAAGGGATEVTQILNNAQLLAIYAEDAQQTVTQMMQYQTMLKNLEQLVPSSMLDQAAQKLFTDQNMFQTFKNLQSVVVNGQRVSYSLSNIESRFKQAHPGYGNYGPNTNFQQSYRNWSDNTHDSVSRALALSAAHADDFATEQQMMAQLQSRSATAAGQLQALQAGNQIGVAMVGQMQRLRQLQMAQMQAQNAYLAGQQSEQDASKQAFDKVYGQVKNRTRNTQGR